MMCHKTQLKLQAYFLRQFLVFRDAFRPRPKNENRLEIIYYIIRIFFERMSYLLQAKKRKQRKIFERIFCEEFRFKSRYKINSRIFKLMYSFFFERKP